MGSILDNISLFQSRFYLTDQLGGNSYLCICAFFAHLCGPFRQKNHTQKNTQKTPSDGNRSTVIFCKFVYLCSSQRNHSLRALKFCQQHPLKVLGTSCLTIHYNKTKKNNRFSLRKIQKQTKNHKNQERIIRMKKMVLRVCMFNFFFLKGNHWE